jgi:hypothetical protein
LNNLQGEGVTPDEFKRRMEEVAIEFRISNKEQYKVKEDVTIQIMVKNVPELVVKVFEFNTETYYRKNM